VSTDLTNLIPPAPCQLASALLRVDTTSSDTGSPLSASSRTRSHCHQSSQSSPSLLPMPLLLLLLRKLLLLLTKAPAATFDQSSHYFSKLRSPRRKNKNQIFSNVEDQTMLQPQSILRKMALIPIVGNKAIKERRKERKIDTEDLTWFDVQCVYLRPRLH